MKRGCSGHPCNLDAGFVTHSTCFSSTLPMFSMSGFINHLKRVKEGRDLEDDWDADDNEVPEKQSARYEQSRNDP